MELRKWKLKNEILAVFTEQYSKERTSDQQWALTGGSGYFHRILFKFKQMNQLPGY